MRIQGSEAAAPHTMPITQAVYGPRRGPRKPRPETEKPRVVRRAGINTVAGQLAGKLGEHGLAQLRAKLDGTPRRRRRRRR